MHIMLMRGSKSLKLIQKGYDNMFMDHDPVSSCDRYGNNVKNRCSLGTNCGVQEQTRCGERNTWGLKNYPLAMVYVPLQSFDQLYDLERAFEAGTLFEELDLPFAGESVYNSGKGGCCRG